jgi:uncharacterized protein YndB with AHSA1/START domain
MTELTTRSVEHSTFVVERVHPVARERVYAALANKGKKAKWFGDPSSPPARWDFDFREGGREKPALREQGTGWILDALGESLK